MRIEDREDQGLSTAPPQRSAGSISSSTASWSLVVAIMEKEDNNRWVVYALLRVLGGIGREGTKVNSITKIDSN